MPNTRRRVIVASLAAGLLSLFVLAGTALANHFPGSATTVTNGDIDGTENEFRVPMVGAYNFCKPLPAPAPPGPDSTHGTVDFDGDTIPGEPGDAAGIPGESCSRDGPSKGARLQSSNVVIGRNAEGFAVIEVTNNADGDGTPNEPDDADVYLYGNGTDVRCAKVDIENSCSAGEVDYNPDTSASPYTGGPGDANDPPTPRCTTLVTCSLSGDGTASAEIPRSSTSQGNRAVRITDHFNKRTDVPLTACNTTKPGDVRWPASDTHPPFCAGTTIDLPFPVPVVCHPDGSLTLAPGSTCGINTSANAIVPRATLLGKQAIVMIGQIQIYENGENGLREYGPGGTGDDKLMSTQGITVP